MMDILVFPQSSGGFWGRVTECGLGSARSWHNAVRRCPRRRGSGADVGGELVNGQSAEAVLDSSEAEAVRKAPVDVLDAAAAGTVLNGQANGALGGPAAGSALDGQAGSAPDGQPDGALDAPASQTSGEQDTEDTSAEGAQGRPSADTVLDDTAAAGPAADPEAPIPLGAMDTLGYPVVGADADEGQDNGETKFAAGREPSNGVTRPTHVTQTLTATALVPEVRPAPSAWDADRVVTEIYHGEYRSLVRLAVLLVHDVPTAEEVVQDAFEAMHGAWRRLRDSEKALSYLRQSVVNKSRSVLRHRTVVDKNAPKPAPDEPSAEHAAMALIERSAVIEALRTLPDRQREAIVLRYYADLSEADIAATMGISKGAVKSHTARAMAALKSILEQETA